jgi:hypothetical protein
MESAGFRQHIRIVRRGSDSATVSAILAIKRIPCGGCDPAENA